MVQGFGNGRISPHALLLRVLSLIAIISLTSGCAQLKSVDISAVRLHDVVAVVGLNPQPRDIVRVKKGYVAFVHRDGSYQVVNTSGMAIQQIVWSDGGVFFADRDNDYHIAGRPGDSYVQQSPKTDVQAQMLSVGNDSVVGIYDKGFSADSPNQLEVQWMTPQPRTIVSSQASPIRNSAQCLSGVFGVSLDSETFGQSDNYVLNAITESSAVSKVAESDISNKHFVIYANYNGVPCIQDRMVLFASQIPSGDASDSNLLTLIQWDTKTHKTQSRNVHTADGRKVQFDGLDNIDLAYGAHSLLPDGTLVAANRVDGSLFIIDLDTGTMLRHIPPPQKLTTRDGMYDVQFTKHYVYQMLTPFGDAPYPAKIFVYGKSNWEKVGEIELKGKFNDMLSHRTQYSPTGFAANPNMKWE